MLKLAVNVSLAVQMLAFAEGLLLAERSGVDRDVALRVMTSSSIGSPMLKARAPLVFHLPDDAWFTLALMRKDVELAQAVARHLHVPHPTAERAAEVLTQARDLEAMNDIRDLAALYQVLEQLSDGRRRAAGRPDGPGRERGEDGDDRLATAPAAELPGAEGDRVIPGSRR